MTHVWKVVGLNPGAIYYMDIWTFFHIYLMQKLYCLFEKTKNKQKEARDGPFKKNNGVFLGQLTIEQIWLN